MGLIALYSVIWVLCWCIFPSSFRWYFLLYVILQSCNSCMSGKNPVFGASLFRSCFLFNRDWHAIACPTKSNVFLLDYKKLPSSVIAILHQQNSQGCKEKRRQEQMELTMGMLRDLLMTAKDPLDVSAGNFGDLRHVEVFPHKNPTMPRSLHGTCVRILRVFLLTGILSHWQDLYWIWNSLRKLTLLNCLFFMGGVP